MFEYPLDLHYSQTDIVFPGFLCSLNTLWIYTTLKRKRKKTLHHRSLNTLWIYTTLKHLVRLYLILCRLNTLWIYTTLKQKGVLWYFECLFEYPLDLHYSQTSQDQSTLLLSLNTLWIYTTLKLWVVIMLRSFCLNTLWIYTTLKLRFI